jgi:carboxyl-terminal processing protease
MNKRVSIFAGLSLSLLSLWLGAAIFFSAVVAPSTFAALRSFHVANMNEIAGTIVTSALSVINVSGVLISLSLLVLLLIAARGNIKRSFLAGAFALTLMALATATGHWLIAARMRGLRLAMVAIDQVSPDDPRRIAFNNLHRYSVLSLMLAMLAALAAIILTGFRANARGPENLIMKKKSSILLLALVLSLSLTAPAQQVEAPSANSGGSSESPEVKKRRESFEIVWQTVDKSFYDPNFNGVDWKAVHDRYAPRVALANSDHELYALLQLMVNELHQSHFWIIPPEAIPKLLPKHDGDEDKDADETDANGDKTEPETPLDRIKQRLTERLSTGIGIDLRVIDGSVLISRVEPGSPAARAGLRPGFAISKVDGKPLSEVIAQIQKDPVFHDIIKPEIPLVLVANYINGDLRNSVLLTYSDARNLRRQVRITRERLKGEMSSPIGNLPPMYTEFEAKRLAGGLGYIRFNAFVPSQMKKVCAALRGMHEARGIIIDLRGNQGGLLGMIGGLGGLVSEYTTVLGSMKMRTGQSPVLVTPQRSPYTGPLAILVDGSTQSAAEIFAAGMQETHRAVVIGDVSAGNTLPSGILKLPTGALFQYAFGNYQSPDGIFLEGRGVIPNWIVKLNRRALLRGDPQLAAAITKLHQLIAQNRLPELIADVTVTAPPAPKSKNEPDTEAPPVQPPPPPPKLIPAKPEPAAAKETDSADPNRPSPQQIIDRYIEAAGGESALLKITSRVSTGTIELPMGLNGTLEVYERAPNRSSVIMNLDGFGVVQQTFNGRSRWLQDPIRGYLSFPDGNQETASDDIHRELRYRRMLSSLRFEGKDKVGDRDCVVLDHMSAGMVIERLFFEVSTGLLVRTNDTYLEDYRAVDGVKVPFVTRESPATTMAITIRLKEVKQNVPIDDSKFAERPDCFTKPDQSWSVVK